MAAAGGEVDGPGTGNQSIQFLLDYQTESL